MKAQSSIEYLVVFGILLTIFLIVQLNVLSNSASFNSQLTTENAKEIAEKIGVTTSLAGHSSVIVQFTLPPFLANGYNYTVSIYNTSIALNWSEGSGRKSVLKFIRATQVINSTGALNFTLIPGTTYRAEGSGNGVKVTRV